MVVGEVLEFKKVHPVNYWIRIMCFAFSIVFLMLWISGTEDVEAATTSVFNITDKTPYDDYNLDGTHTKDDYTVVPYVDSDDDLMVAYRRPGGTWNHTEIAPANYLSNTWGWKTAGAVVTSNNSVLVYANFQPSAVVTSCLWISYGDQNFTDPWTYFVVKTGASGTAYEIAINDTDHVCVLAKTSGALYAGIYDFQNHVMDEAVVNWFSGTNAFGSVCANKTGVFYIAYGVGLTAAQSNVRDYDKNEANIPFTPGWCSYNVEIVCLENDYLAVGWIYDTGPNAVASISIQQSHEGAFTHRQLSVVMGQTFAYTPAMSIVQNSSAITIGFYSFTNNNWYKYNGNWNDDQATWQASQVVLFTEALNSPPIGGFNSIWPRASSTSFCQPTTGWVFIIHKDDPAPEDTLYLIFDGLNWTGDMTYVPPGPGPGPGPTEAVSNWTWWGDAGCISSFMIVAVVLLVGIIFLQMSTRR